MRDVFQLLSRLSMTVVFFFFFDKILAKKPLEKQVVIWTHIDLRTREDFNFQGDYEWLKTKNIIDLYIFINQFVPICLISTPIKDAH